VTSPAKPLLLCVGCLGAACRWTADLASELVALLFASTSPRVWRRAPVRRELMRQMRSTGVRALPFVLLVGAIIGVVLFLRALDLLRLSGSSDELAPSLIMTLLRDPGPIVVNLIVLGRSGSAIVAELAGLRASGDDRLLRSHGVDPFELLVLPRAVAIGVSVVCLTTFFNAAALLTTVGASALGDASPVGPLQMLRTLALKASWSDAAAFLIRSALPATLFGLLACRVGLSHEAGAGEIARALPGFYTQSVGIIAIVSFVTLVAL